MYASMFAGFNTAVRGMQAAQLALSVNATNISHSNDPNYTRREAVVATQSGIDGPGILRLRDAFVDGQYRIASGAQGQAGVRQDTLSRVEDVFGDPVNGGLRQAIDAFFDAWQGLSDNPADGSVRLNVLYTGKGFVQQIRSTYSQLEQTKTDLNGQLTSHVMEVNGALKQVFELNKQISYLSRNGMNDADLRDQRDALLDKLATLAGASATEQKDGSVEVVIGNTVAVSGPTVRQLAVANDAAGVPQPVWDLNTNEPYSGGGAIAGLVSVRDGELTQIMQEIDTLGKTVANQVNAIHQSGVGQDGSTGINFFNVGPGPAQIDVNPALQPEQLAAATPDLTTTPPSPPAPPAQSNIANAQTLAHLGDTAIPGLASSVNPDITQSPRAFYQSTIGWLGELAQEANQTKSMADAHVQAGGQQRQEQMGVNLDEEATQMMVQQKVFAAASRAISIMDQMLGDLMDTVR